MATANNPTPPEVSQAEVSQAEVVPVEVVQVVKKEANLARAAACQAEVPVAACQHWVVLSVAPVAPVVQAINSLKP